MLKVQRENLPHSRVRLTVSVPPEMMTVYFSRVLEKLSPQAQVKGFRPGMAPRSMTISAVGENRLTAETVDLALNETYAQVLKEQKLLPVAMPKIVIKMLKDLTTEAAALTYEAEVDVSPQVKMGDYKKLEITKPKVKLAVSKDEVERVLSHLARSKAEFKDIDRPVKEGDRVEINFEGSERGVKIENLSSKNYPVILGSKVLLLEFEKNLIGLKKGEKKEFTLKISKHEEKIKNPIDFKVEVLSTQEVLLPALDDNLAKDFQKNTITELKKAIKEDIIKQKELQNRQNRENAVLEALLKVTQIDLPESLINQEVDRRLEDIQKRATGAGLTWEKYLVNLKKTAEEFKSDLRPQSEKTIKIGMALAEVAKREGIDPNEKEAVAKVVDKLVKLVTKEKNGKS